MSLSSQLSIGVTCGLLLSLSTPLTISAIFHNNSPAIAMAQAQTQPTQTQSTQTQPTAFSDVSTDYWAHDYIEGLAKSNVISGFPDGTFKPNDPVTRAQFAAILRQAFLQSQPTTAQSFKDVPANYWATDAISAARSAGFLSGYPDNTFKPNDRIVRVQALVSLANGLKYPAGNSQSLSNYKDAAAVPAYARASTAAAAQANLVVSYPALDQISPNRAASRAEVAAFVYQALVKAGRAEPIAMKRPKDWQLEPIATISAKVGQMDFDQSGQRLGAIADLGKNVQIWDVKTGALLRKLTADEPDSTFIKFAISPDGTKVATVKRVLSTKATELSVHSVETGSLLNERSLNPSETRISEAHNLPDIGTLTFSPDSEQLAVQVVVTTVTSHVTEPAPTILYQRLNFIEVATDNSLQSIDLGNESAIPTFSPDGRLLSIDRGQEAGKTSEHIDIWQLDKDNQFAYFTKLPLLEPVYSPSDLAFTTSGLLNIATRDGSNAYVDTWNVQTGEKIGHALLPNEECINITGATPSPDGTSYYANYPNLGNCFGNIQTGSFQRTFVESFPATLQNLAFSGNGDYLAVAAADGPSIVVYAKGF